MVYTQHATLLLYLMLWLQSFWCGTKVRQSVSKVIASPKYYRLADAPVSKVDDDNDNNDDDDMEYGYGSDEDSSENSVVQQLPEFPAHKKDKLNFNFEAHIQILRKVADAKRGIIWNLSDDRLLRKVVDGGNGLYAAEDYAVQILNIYRAAKKICTLFGKDGSIFANMAHKFLDNYTYHATQKEDFWIQKVKKINHTVVSKLHQMAFPNENTPSVNQKLRLAENYVGLDDPHYNITTMCKVEDEIVKGKKFALALEDRKWLTVTEAQKSAFINRKSKVWYMRLEPFEQKFIDAYLDKFLDGQHYIPTQIRNIPGCRNAYQKRILAYDASGTPTVLGSYYHSGSLVSPIEWADKKTDWEITQGNWNQIQHQDANVTVVSINYNKNIPGFKQLLEKKIVEDMRRVVGDDQFMNLSINEIGTSFNIDYQYNKLLEETIRVYKDLYPDLCNSFKKDPKDQNFFCRKFCSFLKKDLEKHRKKQIEKIKDPKDQSFFKRLGALEKAAQTFQILNNLKQTVQLTDNPNATICANYITCKALLSKATVTHTPSSSVLLSCKSGKDRTGVMSYWVDSDIIRAHYPWLDIHKYQKIDQVLAHSGHYQFLSSVNGGMPGRFGMKPVKGNAISRLSSEQLFAKAAQFTEFNLN